MPYRLYIEGNPGIMVQHEHGLGAFFAFPQPQNPPAGTTIPICTATTQPTYGTWTKLNEIVPPGKLPANLLPDLGSGAQPTLGIDANRDGVRDDIEAVIAYSYGANAVVRAYATKVALLYQAWLNNPPSDKASAVAMLLDEARLGQCLKRITMLSHRESAVVMNDVKLRTFNTKARAEALFAVTSLAGVFVVPTVPGVC